VNQDIYESLFKTKSKLSCFTNRSKSLYNSILLIIPDINNFETKLKQEARQMDMTNQCRVPHFGFIHRVPTFLKPIENIVSSTQHPFESLISKIC
jgi:hypothetical protein